MDAFREWWAKAVRSGLSWIGEMFGRLIHGVTDSWDIRFFVFGAGAVVILGLFMLMRRKN